MKKEIRKMIKEKGIDNVDWEQISRIQLLSESFIREFSDKVDWFWISSYQILSESFIREFSDKVDWNDI